VSTLFREWVLGGGGGRALEQRDYGEDAWRLMNWGF